MSLVAYETGRLEYQPVSIILVSTLLASFSFLTAFTIRDVVLEIIYRFSPGHSNRKLFISIFFMLFFLFVTVFLAYMFQDAVKSP